MLIFFFSLYIDLRYAQNLILDAHITLFNTWQERRRKPGKMAGNWKRLEPNWVDLLVRLSRSRKKEKHKSDGCENINLQKLLLYRNIEHFFFYIIRSAFFHLIRFMSVYSFQIRLWQRQGSLTCLYNSNHIKKEGREKEIEYMNDALPIRTITMPVDSTLSTPLLTSHL